MNLPFAVSDPNVEPGAAFRPKQMLSCRMPQKADTDLTLGMNQLYILPSSSDWTVYRDNGWQGYMPGTFYSVIRVKTVTDKFPRTLRVRGDNHLTNAFWKLYNALCPNKTIKGTELDVIKSNGFDAAMDHRCLINVVRNTQKGLSPVMWLDAGAERPGMDPSKITHKRLTTTLMDGLGKVYQATNRTGVELDYCALLELAVEFRGTIPNYNYALPVHGAGGFIFTDLSALVPDPKVLDESGAWAMEVDELPDLKDIPALRLSRMACDVLGLPTDMCSAHMPVGQPPVEPPRPSAAFAAAVSAHPVAPPPPMAAAQPQAPAVPSQPTAVQPPPAVIQPPPAVVPSPPQVDTATTSFSEQMVAQARATLAAQAQPQPQEPEDDLPPCHINAAPQPAQF